MSKDFLNFLKDAYSNGLCNEYKDELRRCHEDKLELMRLAMRQQSIPFVATKMFEGVVKKDYLLNTFGEYLNGYVLKDCDNVKDYTYTWYVGYDYANDIEVKTDVVHISCTDSAQVVVESTKCPTLYISNNSKVNLVCEGYNSVRVYLLDNSKLVIDDIDEESTVTIYKYSDKCEVEQGKFCFGKVKEFSKELRL